MPRQTLTVSAPGRICLLGDHQDYMGLPVIAAAIDLRIRISGTSRNDRQLRLDLPDIGSRIEFTAGTRVPYELERDYFRSGYNVLRDHGLRLHQGWEARVRSTIPINSGTSSSSALTACWIAFLLAAAEDPRQDDRDFIARLAYQAEVLEFGEPGGMMDHFAASYGHTIFLDFAHGQVERLPARFGAFVIGDSGEPKDTKRILANTKTVALQAVERIRRELPNFDLRHTPAAEAAEAMRRLPPRHAEVLQGVLADHALVMAGYALLQRPDFDARQFGDLLLAHHEELARRKQVSTPKIDRLLAAAMAAGALGGKIYGSGGGGCMFAYAPQQPEAVAEAIRRAGGVPTIVRSDQGIWREG